MQFTPPDIPGDPFLDTTIEHLFADVWARPGLGVRERRLITLTILIAIGNEMTLRLHFGAAMKSGDLSRHGDRRVDPARRPLRRLADGSGGVAGRAPAPRRAERA